MSGLFSLNGDPIGAGRLQGAIVANTPLKQPMDEFNKNPWMQAMIDPMFLAMNKLPAQYQMESPWAGMHENEDSIAKKKQEGINQGFGALATSDS